jgi:hypothetical protein
MQVSANITNHEGGFIVHTHVAPTEPGKGPEVATRRFHDMATAMQWMERFLTEGTAAEWDWVS